MARSAAKSWTSTVNMRCAATTSRVFRHNHLRDILGHAARGAIEKKNQITSQVPVNVTGHVSDYRTNRELRINRVERRELTNGNPPLAANVGLIIRLDSSCSSVGSIGDRQTLYRCRSLLVPRLLLHWPQETPGLPTLRFRPHPRRISDISLEPCPSNRNGHIDR